LYFKCGDRFTAHQHLDNGHFMIYRRAPLAGDGGHYDGFGSSHDVNYHLRTIAHSTILVRDPSERWPGIRAGKVTGNDGGQHHDWPHHNGAVVDPAAWKKDRARYDIADLLAFEDGGAYVYVAGDCTRSYSAKKMKKFVRQIVYLRPGTFVVFDRVRSTFKKTWLLQAAKVPKDGVIANGEGRLFVQTVLPERAKMRVVSGDDLYRYGGKAYPPSRDTGPAPEARIEVDTDGELFLHVLTATDAGVRSVPQGKATLRGREVRLTVGRAKITFVGDLGGRLEIGGRKWKLKKGLTK
jgi:heparin/heparan-sulfate lyase